MESALPNGLNGALKAFRLHTEGDTTYNGDVVLQPDELSLWDGMQTAVGLGSPTQSRRYEKQRQMQAYKDHFTQKTSDLKREFSEARKARDNAAETRLKMEWKQLQDAKKEAGFRKSPLSDLMRAPAAQRKRERQVIDGIKYDRGTRGFVETQNRAYD